MWTLPTNKAPSSFFRQRPSRTLATVSNARGRGAWQASGRSRRPQRWQTPPAAPALAGCRPTEHGPSLPSTPGLPSTWTLRWRWTYRLRSSFPARLAQVVFCSAIGVSSSGGKRASEAQPWFPVATGLWRCGYEPRGRASGRQTCRFPAMRARCRNC
ncbi:unnamed protein product [Ascophyllum nodosum]